jgi:hypothetical protein
MAPNGPPGDFDHQPSQHADDGRGAYPPPGAPPPPPPEQFEDPGFLDPFDEDAGPTPWYRKPLWLIGWGLLVVVLIGLIVYGITELIHESQGTSHTPPTTRNTIPSTTTTTTPSSATTTTPLTAPPTSSAAEPPPPQQPTHQPTQQPTHRFHLPPLPSVITIPQIPTVITLPPGLP